MRAIITGATGFVGGQLLARIDEPVVLSRNAEKTRSRLAGKAEVHAWDPLSGPPPSAAFKDVQAVFHLAGESIFGRWTAAKKKRIRDSREVGTRNLVSGLASADPKPKCLICASAVGYYGARGDELLSESSAPGNGFLADVCQGWEDAAAEATGHSIRAVSARFGVVLGRSGGALKKMLLPFKLGLGGRLGDGRQWMSWVHVEDVVSLLLHAQQQATLSGAMNVVAPNPVTNREFTRTLAKALSRPAIFPVPSPALKLLLGEMSGILLDSQRVEPAVALGSGFEFKFPELAFALADLVG